jgi:hypothetical protein
MPSFDDARHGLRARRLDVHGVDVGDVPEVLERRERHDGREPGRLAHLEGRSALDPLAEDPDDPEAEVEEPQPLVADRAAAEELLGQLLGDDADLGRVDVLRRGEEAALQDDEVAHLGVGSGGAEHVHGARLTIDRNRLQIVEHRRHRRDSRDALPDQVDVLEAHLLRVDADAGAEGEDQVRPHALDQADHVAAAHEPDGDHGHDAGRADGHPEHGEQRAATLTPQPLDRESPEEPKPAHRSSGRRERG